MTTYKIGYFVGSLSLPPSTWCLSTALIRRAPDDLEFTEIKESTREFLTNYLNEYHDHVVRVLTVSPASSHDGRIRPGRWPATSGNRLPARVVRVSD